MVAKILTKAAQEAKDIWDSYNKKGGKNYDKKFDDDKFYGKSRGTTPTPENKRKQEKKLISEKAKLRKKDPEKYRDVTKSGLTRKGIKPEQGPYESQGKLYSNQRSDKKTRELEKKLSEGRQKYGKKMDKASRGEGSYKDGGMPKKKKEEFKDKGFYEYLDDVMNKKPKPKTKAKDKTKNKGVKIKNGGTLRVLKKGVIKSNGSYS